MTESEFFQKVDKIAGPAECWPWKGAKDRKGYGVTSINGKFFLAHRASYFFSRGSVDAKLKVCHTCDNPPCCNPSHLFQGTSKDNSDDMVSKGRQSRGDSHAQALTPSRKRGEDNPTSVMTDEKVIQLRKLFNETTTTLSALADQFGIGYGTAEKIVNGITWKHLPFQKRKGERARNAKFSQERVEEIRSMKKAGMTVKAIAIHFGMSVWTCNDIVYRQKKQ